MRACRGVLHLLSVDFPVVGVDVVVLVLGRLGVWRPHEIAAVRAAVEVREGEGGEEVRRGGGGEERKGGEGGRNSFEVSAPAEVLD